MLKPMIGGLVVAALATPSIAEEYWVKYDYTTHECSIVQSDTHLTATRFPWSPPTDGRRPEDEPKALARADREGAKAGAANEAPPQDGSSTNSESKDAATSGGTNKASGATNDAGDSTASKTSNGGRAFTDTYDESESPVVTEWKRRAELAKKEHIDVTTALIGSPMKTWQEAEAEMQIMRKCGLKN